MRNYMAIAKQLELYVLKMITRQSRNLFMLIAFFSSSDAMNPRTNKTGVVSSHAPDKFVLLLSINHALYKNSFVIVEKHERTIRFLFHPVFVTFQLILYKAICFFYSEIYFCFKFNSTLIVLQ